MSRLVRLFGKIRRDNDVSESDPEDERLSDRADGEDSTNEQSQSDSHWNDDWSVTEEMMARAMNDEDYSPIATKASTDDADGSTGRETSKLAKDYVSMPDLKKSKDRRKKKSEKSSHTREDQSSPKAKKKSRHKSDFLRDVDEESVSQASESVVDSLSPKPSMDDSSGRSETRSEGNDSATPKERERKKSSKDSKKKKKKDKDKEKQKKRKSKSDRTLDDSSVLSAGSERLRGSERMSPKAPRYRSHSQGALQKRRSSSKLRTSNSRDNNESKDKRKKSSKSRKSDGSMVDSELLDVSNAGLMAPSIPSVQDSLNGGQDELRREILRLHQLLSDALQKVATQTAEQIQDKDLFLKVSTELSNVKAELNDMQSEKHDLHAKLEERDLKIEKCVTQIENLTESLERQRADQALVEADLEQSEADVDKLLIKIEDLERAADSSGGVTDEVLRMELKDAKIALVDKNREVESYKSKLENLENEIQLHKSRIRELEDEIEETSTVSKLQIDELEDEKKALQGKLKGERLDFSSKLSQKEEMVTSLQQELARYRGNSEYEEIAVIRDELSQAKSELQIATKELESTQRILSKVKGEKEDLLERNNKLNADVKRLEKSVSELTFKSNDLGEKVLKWTEQTYDWKARADAAEKKLQALSEGNEITSDSGSMAEEAPQGLFLQAVMDKQENSKKAASRWSLFRSAIPATDDDPSVEEIRIKSLEEQNSSLVTKNSELQSELVKLQSSHKDEIYNKQKQISQLEGENEALKLKNQTLEEICANKSERSS